MREVVFLKQNEKKWQEIEVMLQSSTVNPDRLAELYIEITDDLAYSQTNYPKSNTTVYLNGLARDIFKAMNLKKKNGLKKFWNFWRVDLPLALFAARKYFLYSFIVFMISVAIGLISTKYDDEFIHVVLGPDYVEETEQNIKNGDPMAIYKSSSTDDMFFAITINNIKVSFMCFGMGLFTPFGAGYILFSNGVMLGTFKYFLHDRGVTWDQWMSVWIHGTIEISSIVIAGGAGILLGLGFLFPGSLTRKDSLIDAAKKGLIIMVGLIPMFIIAGFLESYVTRHTEWPLFLKSAIIIVSFILIVFYFFINPYIVHRKSKLND